MNRTRNVDFSRVPDELLDQLLRLDPSERDAYLSKLSDDERNAFLLTVQYSYDLFRLPHQVPPEADWRWWFLCAGRSTGKTYAASTWITEKAMSGMYQWITLVAPTRESMRKVMINGPSGLINVAPPWFKPTFSPSKLLLTWPNGIEARCYSAEKPERLRGEQHEILWVEELAAWPNLESFDQLDIGLRLGPNPQGIITSTPKPRGLILDLALGPKVNNVRVPRSDVVVTKASSEANFYISEKVHENLRAKYGSSRFGRQELDAELLERTGEELFTEDLIEAHRVFSIPSVKRIVVAVDPTRSDDPTDECGIIVAALGEDDHCYILEDCSLKASPMGWATEAITAFNKYRADVIVYEKNRLGKKTENTLRVIDRNVKWEPVVATDGKLLRADPVSALFEKGMIHLVGYHELLQDEMINWSPSAGWSPNRLDAFVWSVTALLLGESSNREPLVVL